MRVADLNPAAYNPRKALTPDDPEYVKIKRSLVEFGLVEPLVWNQQTGNLVGGHQRLRVLTDEGVEEVEVSVVDLDDDHEQALNVALNRVSGEWDMTRLAALLEPMSMEIAELTGFDLREMQGIVEAGESGNKFGAYINANSQPNTSEDGQSGKPRTDYVTVTYALTPAQRDQVNNAIKRAKAEGLATDNAGALAAICERFRHEQEDA